jgi:sensor histidine kinase YesM
MNLLHKIINFNKTYRAFSHIAFWTAILLLSIGESIYSYNVRHDDWVFIAIVVDNCLSLVTQMLAAYFLAYFIIPKFLYTKKYLLVFLAFILGSYLLCVFARFLTIHIIEPVFGKAPEAFETTREILTNLLKLIYVYFFRIFSVAFVFAFLKLLKDQSEIQKQALLLEKQKAETELRLLKTQLNPHFLFNTLNNIYSLSLIASPVTSTSIARLSDILDHILYNCNTVLVPLAGEINLLNNYIELEKLRYDDRLHVNFRATIDHEINIAPLILLSIVENSFKHGAGNDMGRPTIDIDLHVTETIFNFSVSNPFTSKNDSGNKTKIGLSNLEHQLNLIYPSKHQLLVEQKEEIFTVMLAIDLKPDAQ